MYFIAKYETQQAYGGPEEGGWYFDAKHPLWRFSIPVPVESLAYAICRFLNGREYKRREKENRYDYTSVLSYRDVFYTYDFSDYFVPRSTPVPHYE